MSQGCDPLDDLAYRPNPATGQIYHGDGALNNGAGGWKVAPDVNQCLRCHGDNVDGYLMTGHKNTLRKLAPGTTPLVLWGGPDGATYPATDSHFGSGSTFNWTNAQVTLGWCDPLSAPAQNGVSSTDPSCEYPYYTLANSHAPDSYKVVAPTVAAGGIRNIYYILGGWQNYGGSANPAQTQLDTVFNGGFTGTLYPKGNFDCARCHTTGYSFDAWQAEPTLISQNGMSTIFPPTIPDAEFSRIPSDGYVAPGTTGTSSWAETGIQCERCHAAAWSGGSHPFGLNATQPLNEAATALCMECHREETITPANPNATPPFAGSITPSSVITTSDRGYCSDLSGSTYSTCVGKNGNTWVYKPYIDHEAGPAFLNGPHARFSGTLVQNAQHSSDLSISFSGSYASQFTESPADPTKNLGCTECHNPHQSTLAAANAPAPITNPCSNCHNLAKTIMSTIGHPFFYGTPFPTGTSADINGSCVICHMQAASGTAGTHFARISVDPNYSTFPTAAQFYSATSPQTTPNTAPETSLLTGTVLPNAVWEDVDLACGQCHVGGNGVQNPYGLVVPVGSSNARVFTKAQLADIAANGYMEYYGTGPIHPGDPSPSAPTLSPNPGIYNATQNVVLSDTTSGATIYYTTDGTTPSVLSKTYTGPIPVLADTTIKAMAWIPGDVPSYVTSGSYTLQAVTPTISPSSGYYQAPVYVTLKDATPGVTIYYTTDGSTPTTASNVYTGPITLSSTFTEIRAFAAGGGFDASGSITATYNVTFPVAAAPTFTPPTFWGPFTTPQSVTLTDTTSGVTIYYTTNGTTPTTASTVYTGAITVATTTTIKAIAASAAYLPSSVTSGTYTIIAPTPSFSPPAFWGPFTVPTPVTMTDTASGVSIYYTTNGTTPTTASTLYTGPVTVSSTETLEAIAAGGGYGAGGVESGVYTIVAPSPTFSPKPLGTFSAPVQVSLSDTASGVTIYYTTNGTTPTTASTKYTVPFTVSSTTTVEAMAAGGNYGAGAVASGTYTIVSKQITPIKVEVPKIEGPKLIEIK